jgi:hypothetical protein
MALHSVPNDTIMSANISSIAWNLGDTDETWTNDDWRCSVFVLANAVGSNSRVGKLSISRTEMSISSALPGSACIQIAGSINETLRMRYLRVLDYPHSRQILKIVTASFCLWSQSKQSR